MIVDFAEAAPSCIQPRFEREVLFSEFQPLVSRLLKRYGDIPDLRKDLRGELYYRFQMLLDAYDPTRGVPLRAYLVRQLSAFAYTFARRQWAVRSRETTLEDDGYQTRMSTTGDPTSGWIDQMDLQALFHSLPDAIAALPARQRAVVIRRYYGNESYDAIASALGITPATARSLLRYGRTNLRTALSRE